MTAADMRRERWQKEVVRTQWKVVDPYVVTAAVLALMLSFIGALGLIDRDMRIAELEAQVQRLTLPSLVLTGQSLSCGARTPPVTFTCH